MDTKNTTNVPPEPTMPPCTTESHKKQQNKLPKFLSDAQGQQTNCPRATEGLIEVLRNSISSAHAPPVSTPCLTPSLRSPDPRIYPLIQVAVGYG